MTYTLSWCAKERVAYLKRRHWLDVFGHDTLEYRVTEQRHAIYGIPEDEVTPLKGWPFGDESSKKLILRLMGTDVWMVQLETETSRGSSYIVTSAKSSVK